MIWVIKIVVFIVCIVLGILFLVKTERIVFTIGHNEWAERYLGPGGTYTMWKLLGLFAFIFGAMFIWGKFDFIIGW